jgi:hypothetical protein
MKNLYDLLRQKEVSMKRLEKEIEAIRIVISMLSEEPEQAENLDLKQAVNAPAVQPPTTSAMMGSYSAVSQNAPSEGPKLTRNWP